MILLTTHISQYKNLIINEIGIHCFKAIDEKLPTVSEKLKLDVRTIEISNDISFLINKVL